MPIYICLALRWPAGARLWDQYTNGRLEFSDTYTVETVSHSFSQYLTMPAMCHQASQCGYHDKESLGRKRVSCGEGVNNCFGSGLAFLVQPRSERW